MKKYYCIGIKGAGMSTLAQILSDLGHEVSGYDDVTDYKFTQKGLDDRGIIIYNDGSYNIDKDTIVTHSMAVHEDHKEIQRVKRLGITVKKYNEIVGEVVDMFTTIGVSGTHGKTTTSSMIRHILENSLGCNYFIGAGDGYATKNNKYFVIESDEFNHHFLAYHPTYSIITNIEAEHMECYKDINDIRNAFERFANQTKNLVVACGDNSEVRKINYKKNVYFYGYNEDNDIVIRNMILDSKGSSFDLYENGESYGNFFIPLYGKHMVLNATAAIIICKNLGVDLDTIKNSLETFHNARRRLEELIINDTIIIDDYAHHPTEIRSAIEAIRQKYPDKKLTVIFKPNTYSRVKDFTNEFIETLSNADKVFLTEIESDRERSEDYPNINSHLITDNIVNSEIIGEDSIDKLNDYKDTVICFMSCASITHLLDKLKEVLSR